MKRLLLIATGCLLGLTACHENLEERTAREAREYTEQYCPTPVINYVRTDSVSFDIPTKTYRYYCAVTDKLDDGRVMKANHETLNRSLIDGIRKNTSLKAAKEAGFSFEYIIYSITNPRLIYFRATYTPKDYK